MIQEIAVLVYCAESEVCLPECMQIAPGKVGLCNLELTFAAQSCLVSLSDMPLCSAVGFLMLGIAGGAVHECLDRVPPAQYHHWGYASTGELWAHGMKEISGREDVVTGDTVSITLNSLCRVLQSDAGLLACRRAEYRNVVALTLC